MRKFRAIFVVACAATLIATQFAQSEQPKPIAIADADKPPIQKIWYLSRAMDAINNGEASPLDGCFMTLEDIIVASCPENMGLATYCRIETTEYDHCYASLVFDCTKPSNRTRNLEFCE